jgi:hypothetical protein
MDQLSPYRPIIERIMGEYLEFITGDEQIDIIPLIDQAQENYLLLEIGWQYPHRIYNVVFHLRLKNGQIQVEQDWTREGIATQLVQAGIPPHLLNLQYQPADTRPLAEMQLQV